MPDRASILGIYPICDNMKQRVWPELKMTQLVSGEGEFNGLGLQGFMNSTKLDECGLSYAVVAIMGPQSSGKSTLLNHLFHTSFREMNALLEWGQTTKGIWIGKGEGIEPFTLVMDLEGTDGRERGQDDTAFERQSALFALAVADVVIINMWCHDIGREHAANKPLLKNVFQVMVQLFSPHKTTLLFVIRDKPEAQFEILEGILRVDIHKIWESVSKPPQHEDTPLSDFFNVEVEALCSKEREEQFKEQVAQLRYKYFQSISPGELVSHRQGVVPASGFALHAENIWKSIKENNDLDLPALNVMIATVMCQRIADAKFNCLESNEDWLALKRAVESGAVLGFGRNASSILNRCLSEYDLESMYYEYDERNAKRQYLESKTLQLLESVHVKVLKHLRFEAYEHFKAELEIHEAKGKGFSEAVVYCKQASMLKFDKGCSDAAIENINWDASEVREELYHDIELHASAQEELRRCKKAGVAVGIACSAAVVSAAAATTVAAAAVAAAASGAAVVGGATAAVVGAVEAVGGPTIVGGAGAALATAGSALATAAATLLKK